MQGGGQTGPARTESQSVPTPEPAIYAADPDQIWNRLFRLFYARQGRNGRQYGGDELDPYLWRETKYLVSGSSHEEAVKLLDEFLHQDSEKLIREPVKRAVFQRDLLAVHESLSHSTDEAVSGRSELLERSALVIRKLALSPDEIRKLPDNYSDAVRARGFALDYDPSNPREPFLPSDLFDPNGLWVCLGEEHGRPVASDHLESFGGRSIFLVFLQVPGGRTKTLEYLGQLRNIPKTWGPNPDVPPPAELVPYPEPPQFPVGTRMALVRQVVLIDDRGEPMATHLTESVQIRVYRAIHYDLGGTGSHSQDFFAITLNRKKLFSGESGGLRAIHQDEREFMTFHAHGIDPFEFELDPESWRGMALQTCSNCHDAAGIHSFLSFSRGKFGPTDVPPPKLIVSTPSRETSLQIERIERRGILAFAKVLANPVQ
jgi:hypothetical protein